MPDYKEMYFKLFRSASKALGLMNEAAQILEKTTQETEEMYISAKDADLTLLYDETKD